MALQFSGHEHHIKTIHSFKMSGFPGSALRQSKGLYFLSLAGFFSDTVFPLSLPLSPSMNFPPHSDYHGHNEKQNCFLTDKTWAQ
jgi:hypothetical protein